jgi:hypothetical protein
VPIRSFQDNPELSGIEVALIVAMTLHTAVDAHEDGKQQVIHDLDDRTAALPIGRDDTLHRQEAPSEPEGEPSSAHYR